MHTKTSYKKSANKRIVQNEVYQSIKGKFKNVIGLGGPDLPEYLKLISNTGIKNALIYEFDVTNLLIQASKQVKALPTQVIFGDILQAKTGLTDTFYDMDFCCSVLSVRDHVKRFKNDPVMYTFSIRPIGTEDTIAEYVKQITDKPKFDLQLITFSEHFNKYKLKVCKKEQTVYTYKDSTPMLVITNNI